MLRLISGGTSARKIWETYHQSLGYGIVGSRLSACHFILPRREVSWPAFSTTESAIYNWDRWEVIKCTVVGGYADNCRKSPEPFQVTRTRWVGPVKVPSWPQHVRSASIDDLIYYIYDPYDPVTLIDPQDIPMRRSVACHGRLFLAEQCCYFSSTRYVYWSVTINPSMSSTSYNLLRLSSGPRRK